MLSEERQGKIVNLVNENKSMSIQMLMNALDASESTIRRDLGELDKQGLLEKDAFQAWDDALQPAIERLAANIPR